MILCISGNSSDEVRNTPKPMSAIDNCPLPAFFSSASCHAEKKRDSSRGKEEKEKRKLTDPTLLLVREKGRKLVGRVWPICFPFFISISQCNLANMVLFLISLLLLKHNAKDIDGMHA